ncbi:MAG TPA: carboxypeptidase-like regulatory domain-containing protein, partial [Candidatus Eremiobacteraceae bacterium]
MIQALFEIGLAAALATAIVMTSSQSAQAAGGVIGNLRGSVVEANTGAPVSGAAITAVSPSGAFRATSDARGFFAILQIPTDTYTVTISKASFLPQTISGVTVLGDQSQSIGIIRLAPEAKTIGKVSVVAHSASSAFQPSQTVDETTFSGRRVDQALGETGSTNFNQLVLSAPGVIQTAAG